MLCVYISMLCKLHTGKSEIWSRKKSIQSIRKNKYNSNISNFKAKKGKQI